MKKFYEAPGVSLITLQTGDIMNVSLLDGYAFDDAVKDHLHDVSGWLSQE